MKRWLLALAALWCLQGVAMAETDMQPQAPSCGALLTCDVCTAGQRSCRLIDTAGNATDVFVERCNAQSPSAFPRPVAMNGCPEILCEPCRQGRTSCRVVGPSGGVTDVYVPRCQANGQIPAIPAAQPPQGGQQCLPQILCEPCAQGQRSCRVVNPQGRISDVYVERCGH